MIGLGRMILSYPTLPADTLEKGSLTAKSICRTFSDCTTAPRNGLISGCYPLDKFYAAKPEAAQVESAQKGAVAASGFFPRVTSGEWDRVNAVVEGFPTLSARWAYTGRAGHRCRF